MKSEGESREKAHLIPIRMPKITKVLPGVPGRHSQGRRRSEKGNKNKKIWNIDEGKTRTLSRNTKAREGVWVAWERNGAGHKWCSGIKPSLGVSAGSWVQEKGKTGIQEISVHHHSEQQSSSPQDPEYKHDKGSPGISQVRATRQQATCKLLWKVKIHPGRRLRRN